jgi:hypothetical protein
MILVLILLLMVVFGAATFVLFYASIYYQRRAKILNKVPLLDVVELEPGEHARVKGRVVPLEETLRSPLNNVKCVYYRFIVEEEKKKTEVASNFARRRGAEDDDSYVEWDKVLDETQAVPFGVEDDSGVAEVAVKEIDVDIQSRDRHVTGSMKTCSQEQERLLLERYPGKKLAFTKKMRYTEITVEKDDPVSVEGEAEIRKGRDPRLIPVDGIPLVLSDKKDDRVLDETLAKAKNNKIFGIAASVCTLAATVWLVVYLASPSSSGKSVADKSSSSSSSSSNDSDRREVANNNPLNQGGVPFFQKGDDDPPVNNQRPQPKKREQPKNDFNPGDNFPNFPPPNFQPPPNFPQPNNDPPKNDFDSLVQQVKEKNEANDVFGMKNVLERVEKNIPKNHPRRAEVFKVLNEGSKSANVFIRGDCTTIAAKYAGKEDVQELLAMLKENRNVFSEGEIFKKLEELKDPASAELMASYLKELGKRGHVVKILKAIGAPAENAVSQYLNDPDYFTRASAIELIGDIGTRQSIPALQQIAAEDRRQSNNAKKAIQKILQRKT